MSTSEARQKIGLGVVLFLSLVFGGGAGPGLFTDSLLQAAIVLAAAFVFTGPSNLPASPVGIFFLLATALAGLAQVVPLPTWLFAGMRADVFMQADDGTGFRFVSLGVGRTLEAVAFALAAILFALSVTKLKGEHVRGLLPFFFIGVACNMLAGAMQFSMAENASLQSWLPYTIKAGLFANVNHFSTLLFASIPLIVYYGLFVGRGILMSLSIPAILLILLAAGSRAGVLIGLAITVLSFLFLAWRSRVGTLTSAALFVGLGIYSFGATTKFIGDLDPGFGRMEFMRTTLEGLKENWVWGVGYGNFLSGYGPNERAEMIFRPYVNHVHNDFLEVAFEGGVVAMALMALYLVLFLLRMRHRLDPLQRAAFLSIVFVLLHSSIDYPMRTMAIAVSFAMLNGIYFHRIPLFRPPSRSETLEVSHNGETLYAPIERPKVADPV
ncbi:O-antigen ligase family protein [Aquibium microcysteis]|uniref:O-antigen ligase family protein n=1 Tax=Aquibium microcysteis TaxID=675281 RepID=UPI00165D1035|nr:O-antigen ligase family protein [Aquibium microcysteis]